MQVKIVLIVTLVLVSCRSFSLDFIDEDFNTFAQRVIANKEDAEAFKVYYSRLSEKLKNNEENKRKVTCRYLIRLALAELRTHKVEWYNAVEPYIVGEDVPHNATLRDKRMKVSVFLIRYGAYEEFKSLAHVTPLLVQKNTPEQKPIEKSLLITAWWNMAKDSVKSFFSNVSNKVAALFV